MKKNKNRMGSQYIDPTHIYFMATSEPNDQELGAMIRKYVDKCIARADNDEAFPPTATLLKLGPNPSAIQKLITKNSNDD